MWFNYFSFFSWFLLFIGVRFSSENWSGCILIIGILNYLSSENKTIKTYLLLGIFFGIAFQLRFQSAFFIVGFLFWLLLINKSAIKSLVYLSLAFITIFSIGILLDSWFYQSYTLSPFNYFYQNIVLNKAANFGTEPWWYYFKSAFEKGIPPLSILFILATIYFCIKNPRNSITWSILPFIMIHFFIGHKELRFLFPVFYFLPYILIKSLDMYITKKQWIITNKSNIYNSMKFIIILNLIIYCVVIFRPMTTKVYLYQFLYTNCKQASTIYFTDNNPFEEISFYKRKNLTLKKLETKIENNLTNEYRKEYIITIPEKKHLFKNKTLIYQTYPNWLKNFNIGNWMGKSEQYLIYEI
jgi:phosphatidylinositol glycan class B